MCYEIDLALTRILSPEKCCWNKYKYATEKLAMEAEIRHNTGVNIRHEVSRYNCSRCGNYHVGGVMHKDDVHLLLKYYCDKDEFECLEPLLDEWALKHKPLYGNTLEHNK